VFDGGTYGLLGDNLGGTAGFNYYAPGGVFAGNVMVLTNGGGSTNPAGNFYPSSMASVGLLNAAALDFRLLATSPYKGKATDGRDPGADVDAVNAALIGVP
jgi:hypothetical protein